MGYCVSRLAGWGNWAGGGANVWRLSCWKPFCSFDLTLTHNLALKQCLIHMATKRNRSDSAASAVKAMFNAAKRDIEPPAHVNLRNGDLVFWDGVVRARARDEWTETDLVVAAQLARCLADIEKEQVQLDTEGTVIPNDKGTLVVNPRVSVLEQFARREMALMRTLRMGGRVAGAARDLAPARKIERQSRKLREELEDDELLA